MEAQKGATKSHIPKKGRKEERHNHTPLEREKGHTVL